MSGRFITIIGLVCLTLSCERENSSGQSERFIRFYGDYLQDDVCDVALLHNGGYAISGTATIPDSGTRMVLIVTDEFGIPKTGFPKYYTEENMDAGANCLVPLNGGSSGFLLCGYIDRPGESEQTQKDIFVVRTRITGDTLWTESYGSSEDESVLHATEGISSGFVLAGYQERGGEKDLMIMRIREDGDSVKLNLNYNKPFNADVATANFILKTEDRYLCACTYDKIDNAGTDILILNFDDELSPNDEILSGEFDEHAKCIVQDAPDRYLILGDRIHGLSGKNEIILHFIETNGLLVTNSGLLATITEIDSDLYAERFVKTEAGKLAIIGSRYADDNYDIILQFIRDYQDAGRLVFGSTGEQRGVDIDLLPSLGGFIFAGTNGYEGNQMISLIRTDDSGNL